jgi:ornithine--oxo-acid transaminase
MKKLQQETDIIEEVRGKGLLNAVVIRPKNGKTAWDVCVTALWEKTHPSTAQI